MTVTGDPGPPLHPLQNKLDAWCLPSWQAQLGLTTEPPINQVVEPLQYDKTGFSVPLLLKVGWGLISEPTFLVVRERKRSALVCGAPGRAARDHDELGKRVGEASSPGGIKTTIFPPASHCPWPRKPYSRRRPRLPRSYRRAQQPASSRFCECHGPWRPLSRWLVHACSPLLPSSSSRQTEGLMVGGHGARGGAGLNPDRSESQRRRRTGRP